MKSLGMNTDAMLMATSCNDQNQEPKLENFLGGHSFSGHEQKLHGCTSVYDTPTASTVAGDYMFQNCSLQLPSDDNNNNNARAISNGGENSNNNSSSIGLSMIKTWLRNQPAPAPAPAPAQTEAVSMNGSGGSSAQTLSLSMSTGSALPLLNANGGLNGVESSCSDNNKQKKTTVAAATAGINLESQTGAIEAVPRKSIDTFGQRTSIYRGVTRF